ncbi:SDR family NAD(P)-dependent oxidoreductase [Ochrobactrum oryzae]|nr:SDR family NAD(P)-dependent oxidoreductase [Brucella oryzae]
MSLANKRILVTGASSGIGAATARLLVESGAKVVGVDRSEAPADISFDTFSKIDLADRDSIDGVLAALGEPSTASPTWRAHPLLRQPNSSSK